MYWLPDIVDFLVGFALCQRLRSALPLGRCGEYARPFGKALKACHYP